MRLAVIRGASVSAALVTRDRAETALHTVQSILINDHPDFELIVVDQSDDHALARALPNDGRLRYLRTEERGLSAGRNRAVAEARHEVVACTDDDCVAPVDWLRQAAAPFVAEPRIGLVWGSVRAAPHDKSAGFVPAHVQSRTLCARALWQKNRVDGMGACMVLSRTLWERVGGFDPALGAGARFRAGDELDIALRALLEGFWVFSTPELWVEHHGFRLNQQAADVISGYWQGTGAAFAKSFRRRPSSTLFLLAGLAARLLFRSSPVARSLGAPAPDQLRAFWAGWSSGFTAPLDRSRGIFLA